MNDDKFHFEIPKENVRIEKYEKTGGGQSFHRENYQEHGRKLFDQTLKLKEVEFSKKDSQYTNDLFFQIETPEELSVKNEKLKIEKAGFQIISYSKAKKSVGTVKIRKKKLETLGQKIKEYSETEDHKGKSHFSIIEDISSIPPESKIKAELNLESDQKVPIIINLYNALSKKERIAINQTIINEVKLYSEDVELYNFANGITSISCNLKPKEIPLIVKEFSTIKEIKNNYTAFVENSISVQNMPNPITVRAPESDSMICIIDSGIKSDNGIFNSLVVEQLAMLPVGSIDCTYDHGSFVASRCLFGDNIDSCLGTHELNPYCRVIDVQVFGKSNTGVSLYPDEFHLRKVIEDIVLKYQDRVRVYNLSLGLSIPINDFEFSELSKLLDFLSKKYKVLFIISSGNINKLLGPFPKEHFLNPSSRIGCPAESILSITVGSIAKYSDENSLSAKNELSPFSRIGPGADLGIKPELVAHGGNIIDPYTFSPRVATYGISADGSNLAVNNGTSFSAPIISQYAQKLFDLYPNSDPNLVKALLCHFTDSKTMHEDIECKSLNCIGFGEPNIENALRAKGDNAGFIFEGQLDQVNYQYISFHIPNSLACENNDTKLKVKITITYDPPVNPDNEIEYSQARISAQLIKPTEQGMRQISISADDKYNVPWNPVIQFEKVFSRAYLTGTWDLRLRLYTRGSVEESYLQDFAVVIEIQDENGNTDVYDDILSQYSDIYKKIEIIYAA